MHASIATEVSKPGDAWIIIFIFSIFFFNNFRLNKITKFINLNNKFLYEISFNVPLSLNNK